MIIGALLVALASGTQAQSLTEFTKQSDSKKPIFIELFSSQGCSSCPPAEEWLSKFMDEDALWQSYFPVSFHVTYWNYLGWRDPFSKRQFSQRQYDHLNKLNIRQVYTPGFLVNGNEWRGWFDRDFRQVQQAGNHSVGQLNLDIHQQQLIASFKPSNQITQNNNEDYQLKLALVGSGFKTDVLRGENRHKFLKQDFTVISLQSFSAGSNLEFSGTVKTAPSLAQQAEKLAWVSWVEYKGKPIQAVGDWLN
ncbi:DUF1223 domain-containing protein [Parashewanella spongiae]|uniref:DUF1223 domain-containing protein n=2 Tax=Parashewanella spongiae TaxID=342950 RepID=A0A3A6U2C6_9GAMM|nr:DUF1223 domain-containing protein [Parashewanella spongiae]